MGSFSRCPGCVLGQHEWPNKLVSLSHSLIKRLKTLSFPYRSKFKDSEPFRNQVVVLSYFFLFLRFFHFVCPTSRSIFFKERATDCVKRIDLYFLSQSASVTPNVALWLLIPPRCLLLLDLGIANMFQSLISDQNNRPVRAFSSILRFCGQKL